MTKHIIINMNPDETTVAQTETETETTEQTQVVETTQDPIDAIEDVNELRKIAKTHRSVAQRYKKDAKQPKPQSQPQEIINTTPTKPLDILRDDAFKLYREGYDEDQIDIILRNGGRKILEDKTNPITLGLHAQREQREAERAASKAGDTSSASEVERKYTPEQMRNMTPKELEQILPHA